MGRRILEIRNGDAVSSSRLDKQGLSVLTERKRIERGLTVFPLGNAVLDASSLSPVCDLGPVFAIILGGFCARRASRSRTVDVCRGHSGGDDVELIRAIRW